MQRIACIATLLLASCTSPVSNLDPVDAAAPKPLIDIENIAQTLATARCGFYARCYPIYPFGGEADERSCIEKYASIWRDDLNSLYPAVLAGRVRLDETAYATCLAAMRSENCTFSLSNDLRCHILAGTQPEDAACFDGVECLPGLECRSAKGFGGCGACAVAAGEEETCWPGDYDYRLSWRLLSSSTKSCQYGIACTNFVGDETGICLKSGRGDLGDSCEGARSCLPFAQCVEQTCVALRTLGEPCNPSGGRPLCNFAEQLYCSPQGTCEPLVYQDVGAPCDASAGQQCNYDSVCVDSVCAPLPQANEPCARRLYCGDSSYCAEGICRPERGAGDPCDSHRGCASPYYCDREIGTCVEYRWRQCD